MQITHCFPSLLLKIPEPFAVYWEASNAVMRKARMYPNYSETCDNCNCLSSLYPVNNIEQFRRQDNLNFISVHFYHGFSFTKSVPCTGLLMPEKALALCATSKRPPDLSQSRFNLLKWQKKLIQSIDLRGKKPAL